MFDLKRYLKNLGGSSEPSVNTSMRKMDDLTELLAAAMECYDSLLESSAEHAPETPRAARDEHRRKMRYLRTLLKGEANRKALEDVRKAADSEFKFYGRQIGQHLQSQEREAKEIMSIVASLADSVASREKQYNVRFKSIAKNLRLLTTSTDLGEIRTRLSDELGQLERYSEELTKDTQSALDRVRSDLQALRDVQQSKQQETWLEDGLDAVTQLPGRREAQGVIDARKRMYARFCVARFVLEGGGGVAHRYSRTFVEGLLREFASRMKTHLGEAVCIGRWGEFEFVAVLEGNLPDVVTRVESVERRLSGAYALPNKSTGLDDRAVVTCRATVVEALRGETTEQMINRLQAVTNLAVTH